MLSRPGLLAACRVSGRATDPLSRLPASPPRAAGATGFFRKIAGTMAIAIISRIAQMVRRSMTQITRSRDGIEPARMEWMTAHQPARGQPAAPHCAIAHDRFVGVLRTAWREAAARRQHG